MTCCVLYNVKISLFTIIYLLKVLRVLLAIDEVIQTGGRFILYTVHVYITVVKAIPF